MTAATFGDLRRVANLTAAERHKIMQSIAAKTEAEQLIIFGLKQKIWSNIKTQSPKETAMLKRTRQEHPAKYDYCLLLLAYQIHTAHASKSEYIAAIRDARQDITSRKSITLAQAVKVLLPLIDELRADGATWDEVAKTLTAKQRKILSGRRLKADYLKKVYGQLKNSSQNAVEQF